MRVPRGEATGVVTLLFTDLVGSTGTLTRVGDQQVEAAARAGWPAAPRRLRATASRSRARSWGR